MPDQRDSDRSNDIKLLTPLLLMGLILACGILYYAYTGQLTSTGG
jgi:hypothetical protein